MRHISAVVLALAFAAVSTASFAAMDMPARKAGLWQMTITFEGHGLPQQSIKQCIDAATDKLMNSMGGQMSKDACSKQDIQRVGATIVVDSVCKTGAQTTTTHAVVTGDFNSDYTVKVATRQDVPTTPGGGAMKMTVAAKWLGACAADQKPGDMIMSNGMKINVRDMPQMPGGMPRR